MFRETPTWPSLHFLLREATAWGRILLLLSIQTHYILFFKVLVAGVPVGTNASFMRRHAAHFGMRVPRTIRPASDHLDRISLADLGPGNRERFSL